MHFADSRNLGYEMTGHSRNSEGHYPMSFVNSIENQDRDAFMAEWKNLIATKEEITMEYV